MRQISTDVLVVGAGPAGAAAAMVLAQEGVDVLAIDRAVFPRDKVCGDGIAPRSVAMLRRLGLEQRLRQRGYRPIREYRIVSAWGDTIKSGMANFGKGPNYVYVVPRRELDLLLLDAAREAGAGVREGVRALRLELDPSRAPVVIAETQQGERVRIRAQVVIAADGSRGSFSRTVMAPRHLEPYAVAMRAYMEGVEGLEGALSFFLDRALLPGYGWVFPGGKEGDPFNVGLGVRLTDFRRRRRRMRAIFDWFLGPDSMAWPFLRKARLVSSPAPFPAQLSFLRGRRREGRVLFAGDCANLVDPLSAEGIAYALESGYMAGATVAHALRSGDTKVLAGYEWSIWRELGTEFLAARALRQFLAQPWANGLVVRLLQRDESLARGAMGVLSNSIPATWLVRPVVWRRLASPRLIMNTVRAVRPVRS